MTAWSRRLEAAARSGAARSEPARADLLHEATEAGVDADDQAAISALVSIARDRPGFRKVLQVRATTGDGATDYEFEVAHSSDGPIVRLLRQLAPGEAGLTDLAPTTSTPTTPMPPGTPAAAAVPATPATPARSAGAPDAEVDTDADEIDVVSILTDTLVETPDLVAIFASVGHEALWANDAFVTLIPIREADKIWLVELLDEWSKGHYEVKVLPALVKYGRWRGRLTLLTGDDGTLPVSTVIVAHRDRRGEIEAVSMVARDLSELRVAEARLTESETRFAALVENTTDIIAVLDVDGVVRYASPAAARLLGYEEDGLAGVNLLELVHPDDAPAGVLELVNTDELGIGEPVELRLRTADDGWRHFEVVASDLSDNPAIAGVVLNARDVTERVEAVSQLAARAYTDALTQLPSRVRILDRLAKALVDEGGPAPVVLLVDVDRFTDVNDAYGRPSGDEVMKVIAGRLVDVAGEGCVVGRLGSDEFVIVMPGGSDVAEGVLMATAVRAAVAETITIDGGAVQVSVSIGVAAGQEGQEADDVLMDAGRAMAQAKSAGRERVEVYTEELAQSANRRRAVEQQLRRALDNDGVRVHYQPIVDIETERTVGAEALLRVHDDEGALLSPAEFIEAAESTGLIARLGAQVLQLTCEQLAAWNEGPAKLTLADISVNVSPRQLADPDLSTKVVTALQAGGLPPERLCLEITESILIGAQATIDASIGYLRELGVRIGLDDFGAGQSSLGYLKRFPLDFVKIDRTLVEGLGTNEHDTAIVRATIELAHNLGLQVTAVGVEYEEQLEMLQILGCDRAQGYLFSPAVPADEFPARATAR
jgi:diguanylate cyclase (GGDEF)-like protein/PAS domain S-box-containing protein